MINFPCESMILGMKKCFWSTFYIGTFKCKYDFISQHHDASPCLPTMYFLDIKYVFLQYETWWSDCSVLYNWIYISSSLVNWTCCICRIKFLPIWSLMFRCTDLEMPKWPTNTIWYAIAFISITCFKSVVFWLAKLFCFLDMLA